MLERVEIIERSVTGKTGNLDECEDAIVISPHFAAVLDGATDKSGRRYEGRTGGAYVTMILEDAIPRLAPSADINTAVEFLSATIGDSIPHGLPTEERPNASATIFSVARREVWQVGDVGYWYAGLPHRQERKEVDRINAAMRSAILTAELCRGTTQADLAAKDPGREAIMPLLTRQAFFTNNPAAGRLAHAVFDGRPVPPKLISAAAVPDNVAELVIGSDGYPLLMPTLAASEDHLAELLAQDPLCIGPLMGTKALKPGQLSYDDRAYLRLALSP